jgi:hypothetical protein
LMNLDVFEIYVYDFFPSRSFCVNVDVLEYFFQIFCSYLLIICLSYQLLHHC